MIKSNQMKKRKEQLIERTSKELARKSYELIEKKVAVSFYEFVENDKILLDGADFDRITEELMLSLEISAEKNPKLFDEIIEEAYNKLEELINKSGWTLDFIDNQSYILPLDTEPLDTESKED